MVDTTLGNVVKDFWHGNVHIRICDDYCRDKTPEDVERILQRIAEICIGPLQEVYAKEMESESIN